MSTCDLSWGSFGWVFLSTTFGATLVSGISLCIQKRYYDRQNERHGLARPTINNQKEGNVGNE